MKSTYTILIFFLSLKLGLAQDTSRFIKPVRLSDSINTESEEIYPLTFGDHMYFARAFSDDNKGGQETGHDIWMSVKTNTGDWTKATNDLDILNDGGSNAVLGIGSKGDKFYLMNLYDTDSSKAGVSVSYKVGNVWTEPDTMMIPDLKPTSRLYGVYIDPMEEVMFVSMETKKSKGLEDLFVSVKQEDSTWSRLLHLKDISSEGFDMSPFLGPDRNTLFFSSNREGGEGDADVYQVQKTGESWMEWGEPKNVGDVVNSEGFDAYFSIYEDSTAYFVSNRDGNTDIYETQLVGKKDEEKLADERGNIVYKFDKDNYVYFDFDEYILKPAMRNFLDDVISKLNKDELRKVTLKGHADYIGTKEYNYALGKKRANTVRKYMEDRGIDPGKIITKSHGESDPMVKAIKDGKDLPEARALNRRVRIEIIKAEEASNNTKDSKKKKKKKKRRN